MYVRMLHPIYGPMFSRYALYPMVSMTLAFFDRESDPHGKWFSEFRRDPAEADWILTNFVNLILREPVKFETAPSSLSEELRDLLVSADVT